MIVFENNFFKFSQNPKDYENLFLIDNNYKTIKTSQNDVFFLQSDIKI